MVCAALLTLSVLLCGNFDDAVLAVSSLRAVDKEDGPYESQSPAEARIEAWEFLLATGGLQTDLSWVFVPGHPRGDKATQNEVRRQLRVLQRFMTRLKLSVMRPDSQLIKGGLGRGTHSRALVEPGQRYVVYLHHGCRGKGLDTSYRIMPAPHRSTPQLAIPAGSYRSEWLDPASGKSLAVTTFSHRGGNKDLVSPSYTEDIVLFIERVRR
jgi:hypothetical protein